MRRLLLLLGLVAVLAGSTTAGAATTTVTITKTGFHAASVVIAVGDTVTWLNRDTANHQVTADAGTFTSPVLKPGQSWSFTFTKADFYPYRDKLNETLRGSVTANEHGGVTITQTGFAPKAVSIAAGETVTWTNRDARGGSHQVLADDGSFLSPVLKPGQSYSHTFDTAGSFNYHDGVHPSFTGSVNVAAGPPVVVTMQASRTTLIAGGSVNLTGTLSSAKAGETVTIVVQPVGMAQRTITLTTDATGTFSVRVHPQIGTTYQAMLKSAQTGAVRAQSPAISIGVHPRVTLRRVGHGRFSTVVLDQNEVAGDVVYLTRWIASRHAYVVFAHARLRATTSDSVFVATFRTRLRHQKLRAYLPAGQAGPGYLAGYSNFIVS
jgi:plastocyanin